jgi:hypothetical protein
MNQVEQTKQSINNALSALDQETSEVIQASKRLNENLVEAVRRIWRQLLLIWVVVIALAISYFLAMSKGTQVLKVAGVSQDAASRLESGKTSAGTSRPDTFPDIPQKEELVKVLNQLREAQYRKDIDRFLQVYAPTFPGLNRKREQTLNIWSRYDYLDLHFDVTDIRHLAEDAIGGTIAWDIKARDRKTDTVKSLEKSYRVQFSKISGQWFIQKLEAADDQDPSTQQPG